MNKPLTGLVAIALAMGATAPVFAASPHPEKATAETCQTMAGEVEQAIAANPTAKKLDLAKKRQEEGDKLCKSGKYADGVKHYKMAMEDVTGKASHK